MADKEISELTAATTPLTGAELIHIDQGGDSRKVTLSDVAAISTGAMLKATYDPNDDGIISVANGGTNSATASGARTNLGLKSMAVQDASAVAITGGSVTGITDLAVADGGSGASDAAGARTNFGLVIGTDVMAYSANLAGFAATTVANVLNRVNHTGTQLAETISDFSTAADLRITAAIGSTVQAWSDNLDGWSALAPSAKQDASDLLTSVSALSLAAGDLIYATGATTVARLPAGTNGQVLALQDGAPKWDTELVVGGLLAANDLSDVDDAETALSNIGGQPLSANLTEVAAVDPGASGLLALAASDAVGLGDLVSVKPTNATAGVNLLTRHGSYIDAREENVAAGAAADQAAGLIAAFARGRDEGKEVVLPPGNIRCDTQLPIYSGLRLIGRDQRATLDFSNAGAITSMFSGVGTLATATLLTAQGDPGDSTISSTAHGLAIGDWCRLTSTIDSNSSAAGDLRLGDRADVVPFVETLQVAEVVSADSVRLRGALRFVYPIGSSLQKVNAIVKPRLREFLIEADSLVLAPFNATLTEQLLIEDVRVLNAGTSTILRGCFGGTRLERFEAIGDPANVLANLQFLKILDGSTGVFIDNPHMANGDQMIDITYTPGGSLVGPVLDTTIQGGLMRGADENSAIVDHPGALGTSILGVTFQDCMSAIFIRSRNAIVSNNRGFGLKSADSSSAGIRFGENGYWGGATCLGNTMENFDVGFQYAGAVATLSRSTLDTGNTARACRVGMALGNATTSMTDLGFKSRDFRGERITETGFTINGTGDGVDIVGFQIDGPVTNAGIDITGDLVNSKLHGEVINLGAAIPALKVTSGTPSGLDVDIRRRGDCGLNSGVTRAMVQMRERVLYSSSTTTTHTGNTTETTLFDNFYLIPDGAFDETARLRLRLRGIIAGTAGTKTLRLRAGASLFGVGMVLNATGSGAFDVEMEIVGSGAAAQHAYNKYVVTAVSATGLDGPTNRTLNLAAGALLDLTVQLANAADSLTVNSLELIGSWA